MGNGTERSINLKMEGGSEFVEQRDGVEICVLTKYEMYDYGIMTVENAKRHILCMESSEYI